MTFFEELFYSLSRKFLKVCSRSVLEKANVYSRTVLEQNIRTFLELFWNHSKNVLELFRDICRTLNGTFQGVFYNCSRKILKVCSRSVLEQTKVSSRTVLEQTIRTFLE